MRHYAQPPLTQSAVSRQIAALEERYGLALFRRLHWALQLTDEGQRLLWVVGAVLARRHEVGDEIRREQRAKAVVVTITPGFAGLWLIPRLAGFTATRPDVDVRISAAYALVNLNRDGFDLSIRYQAGAAELLFGEVVLPMCSPRQLREPQRPLKTPEDLRHPVLLHLDSGPGADMQDWPMWLRATKLDHIKPTRVLHFSPFDQLSNAAIAGQGIALGRSALLDKHLRDRKLVAPFKKAMASPHSFYLLRSSASSRKPEVTEFASWVQTHARESMAVSVRAGGPGS